jgi:hypothetical protein
MRAPNEYDLLSLLLCAWMVSKLYPWLPASLPVPAEFFRLSFLGTFVFSPIFFWLWIRNWKIDPLAKALIIPTLWFLSSSVPIFLQNRISFISREWLAILLFLVLAESIWKPSHRWFCFFILTLLWAWLMPGWGRLDSQIVWVSFRELFLPFFLYFWITGMGRREHELMRELKMPRVARPLRFAHLFLYLGIFYLAAGLTLNLTILRWFSPSPYLLLSAELNSILGWLAVMGLTFALFLTVPFLLG